MITATKYGIEAIFYSSIGFVILLSTFWAWWRTQLGWSIIAKSIALAMAVLPGMLVIWFGITVTAPLQWVTLCALWAVPVILGWRLAVLWLIQRGGKDAL